MIRWACNEPRRSSSVETDATEDIRRKLLVQVNASPSERAALESQHGRVWDAKELAAEYAVMGFMAPFAVVRRKADGPWAA